MEISYEPQVSGTSVFTYEGLFKLGDDFGSIAGATLFVALGLIILEIPFIYLGTYFYYLIIALWMLIACIKTIRSLFEEGKDLRDRIFTRLAFYKIASMSCYVIASVLITTVIFRTVQASIQLLNFSFLPLLDLSFVQGGSIFGLASAGLEFMIKLEAGGHIRSHGKGKSVVQAKLSQYLELITLIISGLAMISALVGDMQAVVGLFAVACVTSFFASNLMANAFKILYYQTMNAQANILFGRKDDILILKDLKTWFPIRGGFFSRAIGNVKAVDGVSFEIKHGETMALVGESGCGKTTIGRTILGLIKRKSGEILFNGKEIPSNKFPLYLRRCIQLIFQDPDASLNPRMNILEILSEPLKNLNPEMSREEIRMRVLDLMDLVSLKYEHLFRFPHEFSGGQKQRIVIARALACNPDFIVLDEPTSALDVSVQAQILNLLKDLQQKLNLSYLFITHNLSVVHHIASRVAVMYLGKIVELGPVDEIFDNPRHPYTKALLSARSIPDPERARHRIILKGDVPSPINPPVGCPFNPRCFYELKTARCKVEPITMIEVSPNHFVWSSMKGEDSCWNQTPSAQVEAPEE